MEKVCQSHDNETTKEIKRLTDSQLARIQRNKQKALQLREARIANVGKACNVISQKDCNVLSRPRDTGGGFLLEDDCTELNIDKRSVINIPAPLFSEDRPTCMECKNEFADSFLYKNFGYNVCDNCRDADGEHCLISKTDAKKEYLLKDCDFDKREPPLKSVMKKNPYNKYGEMKLYLRVQVEERAFEIFGSEEQLEEAKEQKADSQEKRKKKAFDKKVKALRMSVRSSLFRKVETRHEHTYGPETFNEDKDVYEKTCTTCGYQLQYEKM